MRDDEESHFHLLSQCLVTLGADPTAVTPCADTAGVAASGHLQVVCDPRTTVAQALNSMLMIELGDNAGWDLLVELAQEAGHPEMAQSFDAALETERQHLDWVRNWLRQCVIDEAI
jgi:ferritin-like metal-binding protein YciE